MEAAHRSVVEAISKRDTVVLQKLFESSKELINGTDLRAIVEQEERLALMKLVKNGATVSELCAYVDFAVSNADAEVIAKNAPIVLLSDILDTSTIDESEKIFEYVEAKAPMWTSNFYFESCRNHLLRMCNDLLRRLSRTTDTLFCGRILIFLARCLPLMEKSGLNLMSNFNVENATTFDEIEQEHESCLPSPIGKDTVEEMEEGEMPEAESGVVDFGLYTKFWQIQGYFSQPTTCLQNWKKFRKQSDEVLTVLTSWKLEDVSGPSPPKRRRDSVGVVATQNETYFAKYLTSQKLLQLQLNDSNFRRYVLVQFLIVFQYLEADVKFKDKRLLPLTEEQSTWIAASVSKIYNLLAETHPHGKHFSESVRNILRRENEWNAWKNSGCPEYPKLVDSAKMPKFSRRKKIKNFAADKMDMGNPVLTRLWKAPDNFEVCKSKDRQFVPDLQTFIDREGYQIPDSSTEEPRSSEQNYQWRVLRLLSEQSAHFFTSSSQAAPLLEIPKFLRETIKKTLEAKEEVPEPLSNAASNKDANDSESEIEEDIVTNDKLDVLSGLLATDLHDLQNYMTRMNMLGDEYSVVDVSSDNSVNENACLKLLKAWKQKYGPGATVQMLQNTLQAAEVFNEDIATVLQGIPAPETNGKS